MKEFHKTLIFLGVSLVFVCATSFIYWKINQDESVGFEKVGQEFYPDFDDPEAATSLRVVTYNGETGTSNQFEVMKTKDGEWSIPVYQGVPYPVDGKERLANTATRMIGVKRGALRSRRPADHEKFGVVDPLDREITSPKGRGDRLTLQSDSETVLVDYIIGNKVEESGNQYYVRLPKENETYVAVIDLTELSTRFSDWIDSDLLQLAADDVNRLLIQKYSIKEPEKGSREPPTLEIESVTKLSKEAAGGAKPLWTLVGLDEKTYQVKVGAVENVVKILDELQIAAVRVKPPGLTPDLDIDIDKLAVYANAAGVSPILYFEAIRSELKGKGFHLVRDPSGRSTRQQLYADKGVVSLGTKGGLIYELYFGEFFTGSKTEIELDLKKDQDPKKAAEKDGKATDIAEEDQAEYLYAYVTVAFDPTSLETPGDFPAMPAKPPELKSLDEEDQPASDEKKTEQPEEKTEKPEDPKIKALREQYQKEMEDYEIRKQAYQLKADRYKREREAGEKRVKELNERFGQWYYVISAEKVKQLSLSADAFVEPRTTPLTPENPLPMPPEPKERQPIEAPRPELTP